LIAVGIWAVLILLARQYMAANDLDLGDFANQLRGLLRETWYGPLLYIVVYLIRPLILFPASLITLLGGSVFGLWPGFLYVLLAGSASSVFPYALGRWFSSGQTGSDAPPASPVQRFVGMLKRNPFQAVLLMRLLYLPYDAVSILAGSLGIAFWQFFLATALGNVAGTFSYVGIGASIQGDLTSGEVSLDPAVLGLSFLILVVSLVISRYLHLQ
jgi:uncharacterized membrane protein YdjX (TVP38/TMEM64 family)